MTATAQKTSRMVGLSIFTALVIVLQIVATFVKIGSFPVTLTLVPIVVGAAVYGAGAGAWLGGVFGVVVAVMCITGADAGGAIMWNANPFATFAICLVKGIAAGWAAALVYRALSHKNDSVAVVCAAIVSPVVNTGIFVAGLLTFFWDIFESWMDGWATAGGYEANPVLYIFLGLAGVNFLIELTINLILSPVIKRIISARRKGEI